MGGSSSTNAPDVVLIDVNADNMIYFGRNFIGDQTLLLPTAFEQCFIGRANKPFKTVYSQNFFAGTPFNYLSYSDRRIREKIRPYENGLQKLKMLNIVSYEIKRDHY